MAKRRFIQILSPKASLGEWVYVLNLRKRPARWELGRVVRAVFRLGFQEAAWQYQVVLDRRLPGGRYLRTVHVIDTQLRSLTKRELARLTKEVASAAR